MFGNKSPRALVETGQFEGDTLVFRFEFPMPGGSLKLRNTTKVVAQGKIESEGFSTMKDAPEKLLVHVEATKR